MNNLPACWSSLIRDLISSLIISMMGSLVASTAMAASGAPILYHCPGNIITNEMSAREAKQQGCRVQAAANVTILPDSPQLAPARLPASAPAAASSQAASSSPAAAAPVRRVATTTTGPDKPNVLVSSSEQRARDSDSHSIISAELKSEQTKLATLRQKPPSPERADAIVRSESDIAALERELTRHAVKVGR